MHHHPKTEQSYMLTSVQIQKTRHRFQDIRHSLVFWGILVFRISLDIIYPMEIAPKYWMYGFAMIPDLVRYILSYIAMLSMTCLFLPQISVTRPSSIMLLLLFVLSYIPNMALFAGMSLSYTFFFISNFYWLSFLLIYSNVRFWRKAIVSCRMNQRQSIETYSVFIFFCLTVILFSIWYNGGIHLTISLQDVFELRMNAHQRGLGDVFERVLPWTANIILPIGIIMSVRDKRWLLTALFTIGVVFAFSVNGTKTWLFICAISLFLAFFIHEDKRVGLMPLVLGCINILGGVMNRIFHWDFLINYITRRMYFGTSLNNYYWIDFFTVNSKLYFTNSLLGWLRRFGIEMPYDENVSKIIGRQYYNTETAAASGTIADAFSNLGIIGVVLFPLLLAAAFKLLDIVAPESRLIYLYPIIVTTAVYLLNGGILTALVTYGYFVGLLLIWYIQRKRDISK